MRVRVLNADQTEDLGLGTIVGHKEVEVFGHKCETPEILLDSGETVYGYETWWSECNKGNKS